MLSFFILFLELSCLSTMAISSISLFKKETRNKFTTLKSVLFVFFVLSIVWVVWGITNDFSKQPSQMLLAALFIDILFTAVIKFFVFYAGFEEMRTAKRQLAETVILQIKVNTITSESEEIKKVKQSANEVVKAAMNNIKSLKLTMFVLASTVFFDLMTMLFALIAF